MTKIAIVYYSTYGHTATLAETVKAGIESVQDVTAELYQVAETLSDDALREMHAPPKRDHPVATPNVLKEADGIMFGYPARFGAFPAQVKALFDRGGQETTAFTSLTFLAHHGMLYVPLGYRSPLLFNMDEIHGGSPWGAGTFAGMDDARQPSKLELDLAELQGQSFAQVVKKLSA